MSNSSHHPQTPRESLLSQASPDPTRTIGGGQLPASTDSDLADDAPNGWFVGPADEPDRYELLGNGITGGEGITWKARYHGSLGSPLPLAVKVQHPPLDPGPGWPTAQDRSRWRDQATLMRHMRLDHVVRVNEFTSGPPPHQLGQVDPSALESIIIEMEWVDGQTLASVIRSEPTNPHNLAERTQWVAQACTALAQLHSHTRTAGNPAVHRDVSPANCIVGSERGLVLIDVTTMQLPRDGVDPSGRHTPAYSAPEVLAMPHSPRQPSADVYSIGGLAYFCLTGEDPPLAGSSEAMDLMELTLRASVERLAVTPRTVGHVMALLAQDPQQRPHDLLAWSRRFQELATPRHAILAGRAIRRPIIFAPVALTLTAALVGTGMWTADRLTPNAKVGAAEAAPTAPVAASKGIVTTSFSTPQAEFLSPAPGTQVLNCEYFTGTWVPKPGRTIMLSAHNLSEGDTVRYIQVVFGFDQPQNLTTWRGAQYFNDQAVGQQSVVELIEMPLADAKRLNYIDSDYLEASRIAAGGDVLAAVVVGHVKERNPQFPCPGPD